MLNKSFHKDIFSSKHRKGSGYDIPLHARLGTEFLVLLIALMTYLSLLAAIGSLALGHMADKWVSGLENSMTIELPLKDDTKTQTELLIQNLEKTDGVKSVHIVTQDEMGNILSPWLGDQTSILSDLPLPTLITVDLTERSETVVDRIKALSRRVAPDATVDAHEEWLVDLLKLTSGLRLTALVIFGLILSVTALVIAGAVRSRMAIHQRELELLHIMGANDKYISTQFVRYIFSQSMRGMIIGLGAGVLTLLGFVFLAHRSLGTVPEISLHGSDWLAFIAVPATLLIIGVVTARQTVLRVLNEML